MRRKKKRAPRTMRPDELAILKTVNTAVAMMQATVPRKIRRVETIRLKQLNGRYGGWYYAHSRSITLLREDNEHGFNVRTLAHELAHHFTHELSRSRQPPHGEFFQRMNRRALELLGIEYNPTYGELVKGE